MLLLFLGSFYEDARSSPFFRLLLTALPTLRHSLFFPLFFTEALTWRERAQLMQHLYMKEALRCAPPHALSVSVSGGLRRSLCEHLCELRERKRTASNQSWLPLFMLMRQLNIWLICELHNSKRDLFPFSSVLIFTYCFNLTKTDTPRKMYLPINLIW